MDSSDWHNVLIEWVNCLELSTKDVTNIEDLKTFDFLNNLRQILCSKQHHKQQQEQSVDCDILTFIFKLFQRYYPEFIVKNSNEIHLFDLPRLDLIAILSLLLHYTCIHDRRDLFILPLCDKLTQTTQIVIKQFLEKLDDNSQHITIEILNKTIGECMEVIKIDNQLVTTTTTSTPSILQDLFKTPKYYRRYYRFEQRDTYLNELLNELELERQEKLDIQQQLLTLEHLNVKLTKKLELKTKEILQLHEHLGTISEEEEQQEKLATNQKEKLYEIEINCLNQYVKKLEDEQEQLEKLHKSNLKKLKQYEIDLIVWQDRYDNIEDDFNKLSKEYQLLLNENKNLNLNVDQLQTLLDEYRIKGEQSTFECDSSVLSMQQQQQHNYSLVQDPSDNSASVVIEVQLRDVKEENQKLKDRIQDLEDDGILLKNELEIIQQQLKEAQQNSQNKVIENQSLHQQLDSLKKELNNIEIVKEKFDEKQQLLLQYYRQSLRKIFNDFNKIKQDNVDLKMEFQQFCHEISLLLSKILFSIKENETLQSQNLLEKQMQTDDFCLKHSNDELVKQQQQLEAGFKQEINDLKQQLEGKNNEIQKLELENDKSYKLIGKLNDEIERMLFKLTDDTTIIDSQNIIEKFQQLQAKMMKGNIEQQSKLKILNDTVQDYETTISGLKKVIDNNFDEFTILKNNYNQLEYETDLIRNELDEIKSKRQQLPASIIDIFKKNNLLINDSNNDDDLENYLFENIDKLIQNHQELIVKNETIINTNNKFQHLFEKLNILLFEHNELKIIKEKNVDNYLQLIYDKIYDINNNLKSKLKPLTIQKENIQPKTISDETLENEWKKKNMMLKQKLVLIENSKNNLEKKLKQVRDDNKCLIGQIQQLQQQQQQNSNNNNDDSKIIQQDLDNIRIAYGNLMSTNSKLELENLTLRKLIDERTNQLSDTMLIKENYERLLEENCCLKTEIDTIKYKRLRDKDEYLRLLRKEREQINNEQQKSIQDIRNEYESKLQRMKEKMLKLYQEEVYKETQKFKQVENNTLAKTVTDLRLELFEAEQKIHLLEMERDMLKSQRKNGNCDYNFYLHEPEERRTTINNNNNNHENRLSIVPSITTTTTTTTKASTLPQTVVEETIMSRRTCIRNHNNIVEMEDEEEQDLFNNKYLIDLKEGRCLNDITNNGRLSELAWRNSLLPPHLKSSYPAEIQYLSPSRFKEDDIKSGNLEFENSLVKLLPNHNNDNNNKPRKKDFGTTSYKKPGPPTPIKNGGRLSLQGNEILQQQQQQTSGTPKRSTPGRIKALFTTNRNTMSKNDTPTKARRLSSLFKRPK